MRVKLSRLFAKGNYAGSKPEAEPVTQSFEYVKWMPMHEVTHRKDIQYLRTERTVCTECESEARERNVRMKRLAAIGKSALSKQRGWSVDASGTVTVTPTVAVLLTISIIVAASDKVDTALNLVDSVAEHSVNTAPKKKPKRRGGRERKERAERKVARIAEALALVQLHEQLQPERDALDNATIIHSVGPWKVPKRAPGMPVFVYDAPEQYPALSTGTSIPPSSRIKRIKRRPRVWVDHGEAAILAGVVYGSVTKQPPVDFWRRYPVEPRPELRFSLYDAVVHAQECLETASSDSGNAMKPSSSNSPSLAVSVPLRKAIKPMSISSPAPVTISATGSISIVDPQATPSTRNSVTLRLNGPQLQQPTSSSISVSPQSVPLGSRSAVPSSRWRFSKINMRASTHVPGATSDISGTIHAPGSSRFSPSPSRSRTPSHNPSHAACTFLPRSSTHAHTTSGFAEANPRAPGSPQTTRTNAISRLTSARIFRSSRQTRSEVVNTLATTGNPRSQSNSAMESATTASCTGAVPEAMTLNYTTMTTVDLPIIPRRSARESVPRRVSRWGP
jgi:hypothetical protein